MLEKGVNGHAETQTPTSSRDAEGQLPFQQVPAQTFHLEPLVSLEHSEHTSNFIQNLSYLRSVRKIHFPGTPCVGLHKVAQTGAWVVSFIKPPEER